MEEQGGSLNLYSYVNENPLTHYDPDGAEVRITYKESGLTGLPHRCQSCRGECVVTSLFKAGIAAICQEPRSHDQKDLQRFDHRQVLGKFGGKKGTVSWSTSVTIEAIEDPSTLKKDDPRHVFRIVEETKDENDRKRHTAGTAHVGGRVMDIALSNFTQKLPGDVDESLPVNKGYGRSYESPQTVGTHELGHDLELPDIWESQNVKNLMSESRLDDSAEITYHQIHVIYKQYKDRQLNRSDEELVKQGNTVH